MRRFMPLSVVALAGLVAAGATVGSAGTRPTDDKRCEDKLVQTLTVQMSSTTPVNSLHLDTGETYFVDVNGPDLRTQHPLLSVNGTALNWFRPLDRPGIVVSVSPSGPRVGVGPGEMGYAKDQQALAGLSGKESCYVTPPSRWLSVPVGSGGLSFAPYTQPRVTDNRTLTIQIYQSEFTTPGPEQPPPQIPPPSVRYAFSFFGSANVNQTNAKGQVVKWTSVSGGGELSATGGNAGGVSSALFDDHGTLATDTSSFRLESGARTQDGALDLNVVITSASALACPAKGDKVLIDLRALSSNDQRINFTDESADCHFTENYGPANPQSSASVRIVKIKG